MCRSEAGFHALRCAAGVGAGKRTLLILLGVQMGMHRVRYAGGATSAVPIELVWKLSELERAEW